VFIFQAAKLHIISFARNSTCSMKPWPSDKDRPPDDAPPQSKIRRSKYLYKIYVRFVSLSAPNPSAAFFAEVDTVDYILQFISCSCFWVHYNEKAAIQ
jgi:hypothetical protein